MLIGVDGPLVGGGEGGGLVGDVLIGVDALVGGGEGGGLVGDLHYPLVDALVGGGEGGGLVGDVLIGVDAPVGGGEGGGLVGDVIIGVDLLVGGGEGGGLVGDVWTPGTVTPGTTCLTAGVMTLGASVTVPTTGGGSLLWLKFPVVSATLYHVRASAMRMSIRSR